MRLLGDDAEESSPSPKKPPQPVLGLLEITAGGSEAKDLAEPEAPTLSSDRAANFSAALDELPDAAPALPPRRPQLQKSAKAPPLKPSSKAPGIATATPASSASSAPKAPASIRPVASGSVPAKANGPIRSTGAAVPPKAVAPAKAAVACGPSLQAKATAAAALVRQAKAPGKAAGASSSTAVASSPQAPGAYTGVSEDPAVAAIRANVAKRRAEEDATLSEKSIEVRKQLTPSEVAAKMKAHFAAKAAPKAAAKTAASGQVERTTANVPGASKDPCRQFRTAAGCKFGDACKFSHSAAGNGDAVATPAVIAPWNKGRVGVVQQKTVGVRNTQGKNAEKGVRRTQDGKSVEKGAGKGSTGKDTGKGAKGHSKIGGEEAAGFKRPATHSILAQPPSKKSRLENAVDSQGRKYVMETIVVNFCNVGINYGKNVLKRDPEQGYRGGLLDWEGIRRCVMFLKSKQWKVVGVIDENYRATDNGSKEQRAIPKDIRTLCDNIQETPRIPGEQHKSADDEMTIKCAYRRNCRFLDNDLYRDWKNQLRDHEIRTWLSLHADFLQMRYYFDNDLGTFDLLEGNMSDDMLAPDKGKAPALPTKRELSGLHEIKGWR